MELHAIQGELARLPGTLGSGTNSRTGVLDLEVIVDDGLQERLDEKYGPGVVRVYPYLRPVEPGS